MTVLGRIRHVSEGEYLVFASSDSRCNRSTARLFAGEADALTFLHGVAADSEGERQIGELFYQFDRVGSAREFNRAEAIYAIAAQLGADAIRLVSTRGMYDGVVDVWVDSVARRHEAKNEGKPRRLPLIGSVIHTTRGPGMGALNEVQKDMKAWHFTVGRDGSVYQHVALDRTVNHAGDAALIVDGKPLQSVSKQTIGIEVANLGALVRTKDATGRTVWRVYVPPKGAAAATLGGVARPGAVEPPFTPVESGTLEADGKQHAAWWEPFPDAQIEGLVRLLAAIRTAGLPDATNILVGHEDVALPKGRKIDPGPIFPWQRLPWKRFEPAS
jgi:hypothetical protein